MSVLFDGQCKIDSSSMIVKPILLKHYLLYSLSIELYTSNRIKSENALKRLKAIGKPRQFPLVSSGAFLF